MNSASDVNSGWSLRRTLLAMILGMTVLFWGFSAVVVYVDADTESRELFDQSLEESAHLLLSLAGHELQEHAMLSAHTLVESNSDLHNQYLLFQIWDQHGNLLYKNTGAPDTAFVPLTAQGFSWFRMRGQEWRSYAIWNSAQSLQIQVAEPSSHRKEISRRFAYKLLIFVVMVVPLLIAGLWWAVNRMFRSMQSYAKQVSERVPSDLQQLDLCGAPSEIHPLLQAINRLFERVTQSREREQRFTADAAHELRTPLAAIKTNLQVIQRARNEGERQEAVAGLATSVDRATRLVGQLMTLARLEPPYDKYLVKQEIDLKLFCEQQIAGWQQQANHKQQQLRAELAGANVLADPESLAILFRNLMDNALRYTPQNGHILLGCGMHDGRAYLSIADDGPGIPSNQKEAVFARFVRLSGADTPGSGLGLSIVQSIAASHQAQIDLGSGLDGRGLCIRIVFPQVSDVSLRP